MKMKSLLIASAISLAAMSLVACGEVVEVPNASVGKIKTKEGWSPDVIPPSKFRLDACFAYCDKLYTIEVSDFSTEEKFQVFMPKDELNMEFDVLVIASMRSDNTSVSRVFDRILVGEEDRYNVSASRVYTTYAQPYVRSVVRDVVTRYKIDDIASNRERLNVELIAEVKKVTASLPIDIVTIQFANAQFPDVIVKAKEAAKEREVNIAAQEADNQIRYLKLRADLEAAKQSRAIGREQAEAVREQNEIYSKSVTGAYLEWRKLEVMELLARNPNTVFVPFDALDQIGLSNKIFSATGAK